jgi:hypothetical protein
VCAWKLSDGGLQQEQLSPLLFYLLFTFLAFYFDNVFAVIGPAGGANVVAKLGLVTSRASFNGWRI